MPRARGFVGDEALVVQNIGCALAGRRGHAAVEFLVDVGNTLVEEAEELKVGGLNGGESEKKCGGGERRMKGLMHDGFPFFRG